MARADFRGDDQVETPTPEVWRYLGRCMCTDGGLGYRYERPGGKDAIFKKPLKRGSIVGASYRVNVIKKDDGSVLVRGVPVFETHDPGAPDVPALGLEDEAAYAQHEAEKVHASLVKETHALVGNMTLNELRDKLRFAPAPRKAALMSVILRRLL